MMVTYMPTYYLEVIGPKAGILLNDHFLNLFTPVDWSNAVFAILAIAIVQTVIYYAGSATLFTTALTTYCVINVIRMLTMYVVTLEPPGDMILLIDPISATLVYPEDSFAKDLFFSGHVSTMMVLVLVERNRWWFAAKSVGTGVMALFLAWQHVHYTIDLIAAPIITYLVFLGVRRYLAGIPTKNTPTWTKKA
ncbi:MAG: hypothetical protein JNK10_06960 [Cyclobacteriaceae bacterium]|nr:hypothetical protein [Cyclobacteriaceae bacterium]